MKTSDEAFLDEVDNFLSSCTLLTATSQSESDNRNNESLPRPPSTKPVAATVSLRPKRRLKKKLHVDPATKRELEKIKDRKRRKTYRERRQIEREGLQKEIQQLTEELQKVQGSNDLYKSIWKLLGERQHAARMKAEAEHRQLSESINANAALLRGLRDSVNDRLSAYTNASYEDNRVRMEPSDDVLFAGFLKELSGVYAQTEYIMNSQGMDYNKANWDEPMERWIKDPDNTGYFLLRGKLTLPFKCRDICRSRWFSEPLYHRTESRQLYEHSDDPENTIALKFRISTRLSTNSVATVLQRLVFRRYLEGERMVIVWRLFSEGEGAFSGMYADETGWIVFTPVQNSTKTGTIMTTCVRNVPIHLQGAATRKPELKQFAGKLTEWGLENHDKVTNRLKTMLLEDVYR